MTQEQLTCQTPAFSLPHGGLGTLSLFLSLAYCSVFFVSDNFFCKVYPCPLEPIFFLFLSTLKKNFFMYTLLKFFKIKRHFPPYHLIHLVSLMSLRKLWSRLVTHLHQAKWKISKFLLHLDKIISVKVPLIISIILSTYLIL